jgi:hypothetical protein
MTLFYPNLRKVSITNVCIIRIKGIAESVIEEIKEDGEDLFEEPIGSGLTIDI